MPVVKNIPLSLNAAHSPMIISDIVPGPFFSLHRLRKYIAIGNQCAAEAEVSVRGIGNGITQFMIVSGRIYKIIASVYFSYGTGLKKFMILKAPLPFFGKEQLRFGF